MARMPDWLRDVLSLQAARQWRTTAPGLAPGLVLHGSAALAAQLRHRVSGELLFVDIAATPLLREPVWVEGMPLASVDDLMLSILELLRHGGGCTELFDLMAIEERAGLPVEEGLLLYRYRFGAAPAALKAIAGRLYELTEHGPGSEPEVTLPISDIQLRTYWRERHPEIAAALSTRGFVARRPRQAGMQGPAPAAALRTSAAVVYVPAHQRDGQQIEGYWRRR